MKSYIFVSRETGGCFFLIKNSLSYKCLYKIRIKVMSFRILQKTKSMSYTQHTQSYTQFVGNKGQYNNPYLQVANNSE